MTTRHTLLGALGLLAGACSNGSTEGSLGHYGTEAESAVEALQLAESAHHDQMRDGTRLTQMHGIEARHADDMAEHMTELGDALDSVEHCGDHMQSMHPMAEMPGLDDAREAMMGDIDDVQSEMQELFETIQEAPSVEAAWAEEDRHHTAMGEFLGHMQMDDDDLSHAIDTVDADEGWTMCSEDSHMHHGM